jgi:FKBP-type peptidyl-prolyl cis-trans isomerase
MTHFTSKKPKKATFLTIFASILVIIGFTTFSSCNKTEGCKLTANYTKDVNAAQKAAMIAFCVTNNITYTEDPSGILYQIIKPGSSTKVNLCQTLSITYTGKYLNGTQFQTGTFDSALSDLIPGWQIVVPYIGKGGHMIILLPSSLAYGTQGKAPIPPNTPLYFDIVLN